jgi:hypothetical protein
MGLPRLFLFLITLFCTTVATPVWAVSGHEANPGSEKMLNFKREVMTGIRTRDAALLAVARDELRDWVSRAKLGIYGSTHGVQILHQLCIFIDGALKISKIETALTALEEEATAGLYTVIRYSDDSQARLAAMEANLTIVNLASPSRRAFRHIVAAALAALSDRSVDVRTKAVDLFLSFDRHAMHRWLREAPDVRSYWRWVRLFRRLLPGIYIKLSEIASEDESEAIQSKASEIEYRWFDEASRVSDKPIEEHTERDSVWLHILQKEPILRVNLKQELETVVHSEEVPKTSREEFRQKLNAMDACERAHRVFTDTTEPLN